MTMASNALSPTRNYTQWNARRIDLSAVGISLRDRPTATIYPDRINLSAYQCWVRAFQDNGTSVRVKNAATVTEAWMIALRRFLFECELSNQLPFISNTGQTNNGQLEFHLRRERIELVRFFTRSAFFTKFAKPVSHSIRYDFSGSGFTIVRTCRTRAGNDPTLRQWLTQIPQPRFFRDTDKPDLFTKHVTSSTSLQIDYINSLRVDITYSVKSALLPVIDSVQRLPTKRALADFVEANFWLPLVQAHRIPGLSLRQF